MREEVFQDCYEHWTTAEPGKPFWADLADKWGYESGERLRIKFKDERKRRGVSGKGSTSANVETGPSDEKTTYTETDDYINIVCSSRRLRTKEDIINEYGIDMDKWKIEKFIVRTDEAWRKDRKVEWHTKDGKVTSGDVSDSGKILVVPLTRLEVRFVPIELDTLGTEEIRRFYSKKEFVSKLSFPAFVSKGKKTLEWDITDCHVGARFYDKNYSDLETVFPKITSDILNSVQGQKFDKIILPFLGDIFHFEGRRQQTERHGQFIDGNGMNPLEMFDFAKSMFISAIDELLHIAPVEIVYIPGNHDGTSLYFLMDALGSYYRNVKTFSADLSHDPQKYRVFGKNLVGFEHGDAPKRNQVHWLQVVARDVWSSTNYAEVHYGHFHSEEVTEYGGVKLRRLPTIAVTDFYHRRNEYIGAVRASMCFVWEENRIGWSQMWQSLGL